MDLEGRKRGSSLHAHQRQTPRQDRSRHSRPRHGYTDRRKAHCNTDDLREGDGVQGHEGEGGEGAVGFRHGAFVEGRGWGEGETGLTAEEELEGENGGEDVGER